MLHGAEGPDLEGHGTERQGGANGLESVDESPERIRQSCVGRSRERDVGMDVETNAHQSSEVVELPFKTVSRCTRVEGERVGVKPLETADSAVIRERCDH